jgi:hypothetical protein
MLRWMKLSMYESLPTEQLGERPPLLTPWGAPFDWSEYDEPLECGLETPDECEACG